MDDTATDPPRHEHSSVGRMCALMRPYAWRMAMVVVLLLLLAGVNMVFPTFLGLLFDRVFPNSDWTLLWMVLGGMMLFYLARNALFFMGKSTSVNVGENVSFKLRNRLFEHVQQMNLAYYQKTNPGQLSSRVMDDSFVIQNFIQDDLPKLMQATFLFVGLVVVMYVVNWQLALAATIVLPFHLAAFRFFKSPIKRSSRTAQEQIGVVHGNLVEQFLGMEVVKGFTAESRASEAFTRATDISRQSQLKSKIYLVTQKIVGDLLVGAGTIGLLGFGAYHVMYRKPAMQPGEFIMFFTWVAMMYPTVLELMNGFAKFTRVTACIDRVTEVLSTDYLEATQPGSAYKPLRGHVEFRNVTFRYGDGPIVLHNVSFEVKAGQTCAIVGPSGSGKTTLVSLVPRFVEPRDGQVLVDGLDVQRIDLEHLRKHVGIAFQETFLFNSSIFENLRYGRPDATVQDIVEMAGKTGVHDIIMRMPDSYATLMGENGVSLSRGEKQRVTLARAMLKHPKILVLDEATASLESEAVAQILPEVTDFMKGKTTFLVTHDPDLIRHADVVLKLEHGHVTYFGPPRNLEGDMLEFDTALAEPTKDHADAEQTDAGPHPGNVTGKPHNVWRTLRTLLLAATVTLSILIPAGPGLAVLAQVTAEASADEAAPESAMTTDTPVDPAPSEASQTTPPQPVTLALAEEPGDDETAAAPAETADTAPTPTLAPVATPAPVAQAPKSKLPPADPPRLIEQSGITAVELYDVLNMVAARLKTDLGYFDAATMISDHLPLTPDGVQVISVLTRPGEHGDAVIQLGYRTFRSNLPPHVWLLAWTLTDGEPTVNPHLDATGKLIDEIRGRLDAANESLKIDDLAYRRVTLSYINPQRCVNMLKMFGISVLDGGSPVDPANVPCVGKIPGPPPPRVNRVQNVANRAFEPTESDPVTELMVFYNASRPEQFGRVNHLIRNVIDVPDRQIVIEVMVLEISQTGLERLGVEWEIGASHTDLDTLVFGQLPDDSDGSPTLSAGLPGVFGEFSVEVEALIRDGDAEILSRPSVLTVNNRQAYIKVAEKIRIVTSVANPNANTFSVGFISETAGIELNVRPRISADGEQVSMQIAASVTAVVPNEDVEVRDSAGDIIASAPTISERVVETHTRVPNNTPFIIGGLVARDVTKDQSKVPFLGDLPIIGSAFRDERNERLKREVIIIVTPRVLPERQLVTSALPEDKDAFDSFDNELFRSAYRIRAEDVFDLKFITQNRQLRHAQRLADIIAMRNVDLADSYPLRTFTNGRFPGERILVYRQMYEVIKRLEIDAAVDPHKVIFFEEDLESETGFNVNFLTKYLAKLGEINVPPDSQLDVNLFFDKLKLYDKAIAMTYTLYQYETDPVTVMRQPVPHVETFDCPDRKTWDKLLWQLNQPDEQGRQRYSILIQNAKDLKRLRRAIVLKRTVELNASRASLTLQNFTLGRLILMPTVKEDKVYLIDEETAKYFFFTEQYYPAVRQELARDGEALSNTLQLPEVRRYLPERLRRQGPLEWEAP